MSLTKKSQKSRGNIRSIVSIVISLALTGAALFLWLNKQYVLDWVAYHEYQPSSEVASIVDRTTMIEQGKFYFYASKPAIQNATEFNKSCERKEASSAILGCYANNHIYVYAIENEQLDGIKEVTAAHEMLHAVYQRLDASQRTSVDRLLEVEFQKAKDNKELAERMEFYAKYEAGERYNELHSIVATEFPVISSELETHYKRYFSDRSAVVSLHDKYASVFNSLKAKSETLLAELKTLGPRIETDSKNYNTAVNQLNDDIQEFNAKATNGGFTNETSFSSERSRLIVRANSLDVLRNRINQNLDRYEAIRQEYNDIASSSNDLYKSMDSKLAPTPSV